MNSGSGTNSVLDGTLDRRIKLLIGASGRGALGGQQTTYTLLDEVWARIVESATANATGTDKLDGHVWPHRMRIRARTDVQTPMRVQFDDGRIVQINGVARVRKGWLILAGMELGHQQP